MACNSCQEYKGLVRCNRCKELYCILCNPVDSELVDTEPCDHNIVEDTEIGFKSYMVNKGFFRGNNKPTEASNYMKQAEAAFESMPFLKETIKKEWIDKGYKVTYEDADSILIEKDDSNV